MRPVRRAARSARVSSHTADLTDLLERVPGYYLVYDRDDRQIYSSVGIRQLSDEDRLTIDRVAVSLAPGARAAWFR